MQLDTKGITTMLKPMLKIIELANEMVDVIAELDKELAALVNKFCPQCQGILNNNHCTSCEQRGQ
jgi:recombinational DNA repair protein RecR